MLTKSFFVIDNIHSCDDDDEINNEMVTQNNQTYLNHFQSDAYKLN